MDRTQVPGLKNGEASSARRSEVRETVPFNVDMNALGGRSATVSSVITQIPGPEPVSQPMPVGTVRCPEPSNRPKTARLSGERLLALIEGGRRLTQDAFDSCWENRNVAQQQMGLPNPSSVPALNRSHFQPSQPSFIQSAAKTQTAYEGRQQMNTLEASAGSSTMMRPIQDRHQVQPYTHQVTNRPGQGPHRAEEAIRNATRITPPGAETQNINKPTQLPHTATMAMELDYLWLCDPTPDGPQGQSRADQPSSRPNNQGRRFLSAAEVAKIQVQQYSQAGSMINDGRVHGKHLPQRHAAMITGEGQNASAMQKASTGHVQTPPSVTQYATERPTTKSYRRRPSGLRAPSKLNSKLGMGPPPPRSAKRARSDVPGSVSQASPPQTLRPQVTSGLVNMGHSVPMLNTIANANDNLVQRRQNADSQPGDVLVLPGQSTPMPRNLPYPVSNSPAQGDQGSRKVSESGNHLGTKTRITIAISGCTSSGKSILAYLLAAVFEGATIKDIGFAGAQTMYPAFSARVEENPNRKGPITKVVITHQNSYLKPVNQWPVAEWKGLYPYSPAIDAMVPQKGTDRALTDLRGHRSLERYREEAFKANIGVNPNLVSSASNSRYPQMVHPEPIEMLKKGPNADCRGVVDWRELGKAINEGMRGHKKEEGTLETEEGRDRIANCLARPDPKTRLPLVDSKKLEPLRERVRNWIRKETALNDQFGFPGRSVVNGALREMFILEGQLLFLQTHPNKGAGGEKLMQACDVKLFLPTLKEEAIQRCFSQREYMDPPKGTRKPEETWTTEGYFIEVAWKEYLTEHGWLFEHGNAANQYIYASAATYDSGVHVRDFYSSDLQKGNKHEGKKWADETLDWAIRTILFQLSIEEAFSRQAFYEKRMSEAAQAGDVTMTGTCAEGTNTEGDREDAGDIDEESS